MVFGVGFFSWVFPCFLLASDFSLGFFLWHWTFFGLGLLLGLVFGIGVFAWTFCLLSTFPWTFCLLFGLFLGLFVWPWTFPGLLEVGLDFCLDLFWGWIFSWTFWLMFQWTITSFPVAVKISCLIRRF